jgi:hypothetical protein
MAVFRRFDPYAALGEDDPHRQTLAALASLAGVATEIEHPAKPAPIGNGIFADENRDHGGSPAKVANPAKADGAERATLAASTPETENPARWSDTAEGRAVIVEHDGCIPRAWAEGFARLHPDRPPGDVPAKRWLRFINDIGLFLDGGWAERAAALGWGLQGLFGCDRDRPFARIDQAGLLWLLNGDRLIALTENTATIETRTGARQTYRRKSAEPGRVLAWELAS